MDSDVPGPSEEDVNFSTSLEANTDGIYGSTIRNIQTLNRRWKDEDYSTREVVLLWDKIAEGKEVLQQSLHNTIDAPETLHELVKLKYGLPKYTDAVSREKSILVEMQVDEYLDELAPTIGELVSHTQDPKILKNAIGLIETESFPSEFKASLQDHVIDAVQASGDDENNGYYQYVIGDLLRDTPPGTVRDQIISATQQLVRNPETEQIGIAIIGNYVREKRCVSRRDRTSVDDRLRLPDDFVHSQLERFGLDYEDLQKAWKQDNVLIDEDELLADEEEDQSNLVSPVYAEPNVAMIQALEVERPGICKELVEKFDIKNFDRFPPEVLIDMYDSRDNKDMPYGIMLYARPDHNGAFHQKKDMILKFYRQLKELGYGLRIFEFEGIGGAGRTLVKTKRRYGKNSQGEDNLLEFAVLSAHGNIDSMNFKERDLLRDEPSDASGEKFHRRHLQGKGVKRVGDFFKRTATIILNSCTTGEEGGIGQVMHETWKRKVIAPAVPTSTKNISVSRGDHEDLHFEVTYNSSDPTNINNPERVYSSHVEIPNE